MNSQIKITMLSAALAVFTLPAIAQSSSTPPPASTPAASTPATTTPVQSVRDREEKQQDRISKGIGDGQLTAGEANKLETKEADINKERLDMRQENNGHLTAADKAALRQQQNQLSHQIYKDKHNGAVQGRQGYESEVGGRAQHQQDRIAQGVKSGELTGAESSNLEKREAGINKEIRTDKAANGGQLSVSRARQGQPPANSAFSSDPQGQAQRP